MRSPVFVNICSYFFKTKMSGDVLKGRPALFLDGRLKRLTVRMRGDVVGRSALCRRLARTSAS